MVILPLCGKLVFSLEFSTFGVKRHLDALVKKGFILVESNASRGIKFESRMKKIFIQRN
jgi:predicted ArsR family transcriptional regulator